MEPRIMTARRRIWISGLFNRRVTAGIALAAFPRADHIWLDALERAVPALQAPFLTPYERGNVAHFKVFTSAGSGISRIDQ